MNFIAQALISCYMLASLYFTVLFEFIIFKEEGFLVWLLFGSWLAPVLGVLWPFTAGFIG